MELYYNLFDKFCDIYKFEELEMNTLSLHLALAEKELTDCIQPEMKAERERLRSGDCDDSFAADASENFLPWTCCTKHKKHDERAGSLKEEFRGSEMLSM